MQIGFSAYGQRLPHIDYAAFYADPPIHEISLHVPFGRVYAVTPQPGEIPIPLKDHIAKFRRAQFVPDEFIYQLKSKPPEGWSWVIHNGKMKAYRTHLLYARKG